MRRRTTRLESILTTAIIVVVAAACGGNIDEDETSGDGGLLGASCNIQASNYDHSCNSDSDCTTSAGRFPVQFGNFCQADMCLCALDAINLDSASRYASDVAETPLEKNPAICGCPAEFAPCCRAHLCTATFACQSPPPDASASDH
jgi:hypothetical protein